MTATTKMQFNGTARLLVQLAVILVTVAVGWGIVSRQVKANAENIAKVEIKKLEKEVFKMYCEQQSIADAKTERVLEKIDGKLDRLIGDRP